MGGGRTIMLGKDKRTNGQNVYDHDGTMLTCHFKNGRVKAKGRVIDEKTEGERPSCHETGEPWQTATSRPTRSTDSGRGSKGA